MMFESSATRMALAETSVRPRRAPSRLTGFPGAVRAVTLSCALFRLAMVAARSSEVLATFSGGSTCFACACSPPLSSAVLLFEPSEPPIINTTADDDHGCDDAADARQHPFVIVLLPPTGIAGCANGRCGVPYCVCWACACSGLPQLAQNATPDALDVPHRAQAFALLGPGPALAAKAGPGLKWRAAICAVLRHCDWPSLASRSRLYTLSNRYRFTL